MTKQIVTPICDGDSQILVVPLTDNRKPIKHLSIWLCQGMSHSGYDTEYHVSTVGNELDELITRLTQIRDKKELILKKFNKME